MDVTRISLDRAYVIAPVDPRIFCGFLEHLGRAVYVGVYDPQSKHADEKGFRKDVLSSLKKLAFTAMRYPGGYYASGYHWLDGVGPRSSRPVVRELAWNNIEPNQFGTDEFIQLTQKMNWMPMITVQPGYGDTGRSPKLGGILQQPCRNKIRRLAGEKMVRLSPTALDFGDLETRWTAPGNKVMCPQTGMPSALNNLHSS